jgi:hypothetical protein
MAIAIDARLQSEKQVLAAIGRAYVATHSPVVEAHLSALVVDPAPGVGELPAVVVATRSTIEIVLGDADVSAGLIAAVAELAGGGWEVVVLIEGHRSGDAHRGLRSAPCVLQQWWREGSEICFGGFETP